MRNFSDLPPLSLYVHIPWCLKKCPYCDFNSHENRTEELPETVYVDALLHDLEQELPDIWGRQIVSVFIGGGTPSLFSAAAIDQLLCGLRALLNLAPSIEITMEANPGTFEQNKFADFAAAGINRLSIGIQSFHAESLSALGRVHDANEALAAIDIARQAGFKNINLDLMFALPNQTTAMAAEDLRIAIDLKPEHVSYYQLTLEPNTAFAASPPILPADDKAWEMQTQGLQLLSSAGYQRYEISAFARPGKQSEHNTNYWLFGDYVGIGAGAHGKLSFADRGEILRRSKQRHPKHYLKTAAGKDRISRQLVVSIQDTALEFMMNALRLTEGFPMPLYALHTGTDLHNWQDVITTAIDDGLLEQTGLQLKPSPRGHDFLNELLERFMPGEEIRRYPIIPLKRDAASD